jgi:hypothetical protein
MFIQVIEGRVADENRLRTQLDRWLEELAPGAEGWLGGTYGMTDDGTFVAVVRFESEEAARRNADRPEQGTWWEETAACLDGEPTFRDCREVQVILAGGSDSAGFVQLMQGRMRDKERVLALHDQVESLLAKERPEIIGATLGIEDDSSFTQTVAFTSEEAARQGELREVSDELRALSEAVDALVTDLRFVDLHHPWFSSGRAAVPGQRQAAESEKPQPTA